MIAAYIFAYLDQFRYSNDLERMIEQLYANYSKASLNCTPEEDQIYTMAIQAIKAYEIMGRK